MSLFDSASIVVTPNAYKASKLYAIKPIDGSGDLSVTRATTATRVNSGGLISSVANNVPRLDYTNSTCPSILVEPQRTNVLTYSEQFNNITWINNGATIIANDTTSPDGTLTADRLTATGGGFGVVKFVTWTATNKVASCFVKANTSNLFRIANVSGGGGSVTFNLSTLAITATTGFTGSIEALPNGWYRCTAIDTLARIGTFSIGVTAIGESVFVWGVQLEAGANATSYIPTTSASVTRNADVISKTGISDLIGQTEGTFYAEVDMKNWESGARIFSVSDGSNSNRISIILSTSKRFRVIIANLSTINVDLVSGFYTDGIHKIAVSYKQNDINFYIDGILVGTDTLTNIPPCSNAYLGKIETSATTNILNDYIKSVAIWKTQLTDQECINLTTI